MTDRSRRHALRIAGTGLAVALAGCGLPGGDGGEEGGGDGGEEGGGDGGEEGGGEAGEEGGNVDEGGEEAERVVSSGVAVASESEHGNGDGSEGCFDGGWDVVPRD